MDTTRFKHNGSFLRRGLRPSITTITDCSGNFFLSFCFLFKLLLKKFFEKCATPAHNILKLVWGEIYVESASVLDYKHRFMVVGKAWSLPDKAKHRMCSTLVPQFSEERHSSE